MSYWEDRAAARMTAYHANTARERRFIQELYSSARAEIDRAINDLYARYAGRYKITPRQARIILSGAVTRAEYNAMAAQLRAFQGSSLRQRMMRARINANSTRFRVSRLEELEREMNAVCAQLGAIQTQAVTSALTKTAQEASERALFDLQRQAGVVWSSGSISETRVQQLLRNEWSGAHYSDRIWANTQKLAERLRREVGRALLGGQSFDQAAEIVALDMDSGLMNAMRLVRTETSYIANAAELEQYKSEGVEKYRFVAMLDLKTSEICREHDGKIYRVEDAQEGINLPPLHPWCRSTTVPMADEDFYRNVETRLVRDPETGTPYEIPATMHYREWDAWRRAGYPELKRFRREYARGLRGAEKTPGNTGVLGAGTAAQALPNGAESGTIKEYQAPPKFQTDEEAVAWIRSPQCSKELNVGQQNKHIQGTHEYEQAVKQYAARVEHGPSYLTITPERAQEIAIAHMGKGTRFIRKNGWDGIEIITGNDETIGIAVNNLNGKQVPTTVFKIHYGKKGFHIVPDYPGKKGGR